MDARKSKEVVRIELTPSQAEVVEQATGHEASAIELTVAELEQRIAPRLATNANETMLAR